jgi:hypothetical protein
MANNAIYHQSADGWFQESNGARVCTCGATGLSLTAGELRASAPGYLTVSAFTAAARPAAPPAGTIVFNTTTSKLNVWTGAAYEAITSA